MAKPKLRQPLNTRRALKYFRLGIEGKDWYNSTYAVLSDIFKEDTDLFCDFLAATSPNTTVKANVTLALKVYMQWKRGEEFGGVMRVVKTMLEAIRNNRTYNRTSRWGGTKVENFARALKGDTSAIVVDRWMLRAYGIHKDIVTEARYNAIGAHIIKTARRMGLAPTQVQAAIWCGIKTDSDRQASRNIGRIEDFLPLSLT